MNLEEQIKNYRKQSGMSQEQMADKIGVSRQAITKWENGTGVPDISNLIAIAELFHVSLDELLLDQKNDKKQSEYLYESITEYDIDRVKNFDMKLQGAYSVSVRSYNGEKIKIILSSNTLQRLQSDYKIKIDDIKNRIDVELQRFNGASEASAKEGMIITVYLPRIYIGKIELSVNAKTLKLFELITDSFELDGKVSEVILEEGKGDVEINSHLDMTVTVRSHEGSIEINQISSTSKLFVPTGYPFRAIKKGIGTSISYENNGKKVDDFSDNQADNTIELNGMKSELVISML